MNWIMPIVSVVSTILIFTILFTGTAGCTTILSTMIPGITDLHGHYPGALVGVTTGTVLIMVGDGVIHLTAGVITRPITEVAGGATTPRTIPFTRAGPLTMIITDMADEPQQVQEVV